MPGTAQAAPIRLFLDTGILIEGHYGRYGSSKAVLILTTLRRQFRAVLADPIAVEFDRWLAAKVAAVSASEAAALKAGIEGWFARARPERCSWPSAADLRAHAGLLAVVRHDNDMPAVVAAVLARPDWVLSTNTRHWNHDLAARSGLRIAHPAAFLTGLRP